MKGDFVVKFHTTKITVNSKTRTITLYSEADMEKQRLIYSRTKDIFMQRTHDSVYSYMTGKSNLSAVQEAYANINHYKYYIKCDIANYFPSINRLSVVKSLHPLFGPKLTKEIADFVCYGNVGITEGSPLSPAISNIVLYNFDETNASLPNTLYLRYSDDMLIFTNLKPDAVMATVEQGLTAYGLRLNKAKTNCGLISDGVDFLGFHINRNGITVTAEKVTRIVEKIKTEKDLSKKQQIILGWWSYCRDESFLPDIPDSAVLLSMSKRYLATARFVYRNGITLTAADRKKMRSEFAARYSLAGILGVWLLLFARRRKAV